MWIFMNKVIYLIVFIGTQWNCVIIKFSFELFHTVLKNYVCNHVSWIVIYEQKSYIISLFDQNRQNDTPSSHLYLQQTKEGPTI